MKSLKVVSTATLILIGLVVLAILEYSLFLPGGSGAEVLKYFKDGPRMFQNVSADVAFTFILGISYILLSAIIIVPGAIWLDSILNS